MQGFKQRGVALLFTLAVGVILCILAVSLIGLYFGDYHAQRLQQQALQAYWNARSGVEHYCLSRKLPDKSILELGAAGRCRVSQQGADLVFEGQSGFATRKIRLLGGDPARRCEQP